VQGVSAFDRVNDVLLGKSLFRSEPVLIPSSGTGASVTVLVPGLGTVRVSVSRTAAMVDKEKEIVVEIV
jgi:hypothetical protein